MVAISQTFNQRDNNNNGKDNDKINADANAAPLDVDEKSHWAQFAAPGTLATPSNVDAETIADAARAGVDETPDAESEVESTKRPEETGETPKRPGLVKTVTRYDDGEFVCWLPNDVDAGAELSRFVKAASKTAVRVALDDAKSWLLTQVLTLPSPRSVADIRRYYHQSVQGLALSVLAKLGTDDEKFAVDNYLVNAMSGDASQNDDKTLDDADVAEAKALVEAYKRIKVKPFLHLGKFYNRVAVPFIRNDAATFDRILKAIETVFAPNELIRPWNVADKTSAFCDALQNGGMTQAVALPIAKEAVAIATEAASALYWDGAGPEPKQRWKAACVKPAFNVEIGDALKPANVGDKTSFSVDAAEAEAGE
ncbi:MAG: hypothetical protein J6K25_11075 [Thermoguttaceae bacterium]|nr:hypothetical protein [Thermoguttaceae bacterium]